MSRHARMVQGRRVITLVLWLCCLGPVQAQAGVQVQAIPLHDINASGKPISSCWGGIGIDAQQRVYIAMGVGLPASDDVALFQVSAVTGQRRFLTTLSAITAQDGNRDPDETFAKVHAGIEAFGGKMYFATHDFHDVAPGYHRGGHFFSYDPATETFADLSKTDPGGVSAPGQGIIGMEVMPGQQMLIGFTYPDGDVVAYDLIRRQSVVWPGVAHDGGVSRHILTTEDGIAYISYGDAGPQPLYAMRVRTGQVTQSGLTLRQAQIPAVAPSANGRDVYLLNWDYVYVFHRATKRLEPLGPMAAPADVGAGLLGENLALSPDGTTLYATLVGYPYGTAPYAARLYAFDLAHRQARLVADVTDQILAIGVDGLTGELIGAVMDTRGTLYLCGSEGYLIHYTQLPSTLRGGP